MLAFDLKVEGFADGEEGGGGGGALATGDRTATGGEDPVTATAPQTGGAQPITAGNNDSATEVIMPFFQASSFRRPQHVNSQYCFLIVPIIVKKEQRGE